MTTAETSRPALSRCRRPWPQRLRVRLRSLRGGPRQSRGRRVVLLLVFLWIVNLFDLTFTLLAHKLGGFKELNPVAADILGHADILTTFKVSAVLGSTLIFFVYRRRAVTELACWGLAVVYAALSFIWLAYYAARG